MDAESIIDQTLYDIGTLRLRVVNINHRKHEQNAVGVRRMLCRPLQELRQDITRILHPKS